MSRYKDEPIDLTGIHTYPLASRQSKVSVEQFARPIRPEGSIADFLERLPDILAAAELRDLARYVSQARASGRAVIAGIGGHVIKAGLGPVLVDLMRRKMLTAVAMNGAALIHDFEIALVGRTSEDVDAGLASGAFGMADETGRLINEATAAGAQTRIGLGEAAGRKLIDISAPHAASSVLATAFELAVPVTVHVAIGTDIVHIHPSADGSAIGATSHRDFLLLCSLVRGLNGGGVYLNFGSAVVLPEVFLKTVTVVRNLGHELTDFSTANFDFIQHYRPATNVVRRPVTGNGRGYQFTGHHEIIIPLFAAAIFASAKWLA